MDSELGEGTSCKIIFPYQSKEDEDKIKNCRKCKFYQHVAVSKDL